MTQPPPPPPPSDWQPPSQPPPPASNTIAQPPPPASSAVAQPPPPLLHAVAQPPPFGAPSTTTKTGAVVSHTYDHARSRWGLGDAFTAIGIYFAASIGLVLVLILLVGSDDVLSGPLLPVVVVGPHVALLAHAIWVSRAKGTGLIADFKVKLTVIDIPIGIGLFVGSLFAAGIVAVIITQILGEELSAAATDIARQSSDDTLTIWIYLFAILGATFVPFVEEVVFRGLLWSALEKRGMKPGLVLVTTSVLFAFIHLELTRTPVLFVVGLGFGLGRLFTGRIGAPILTHMFINTLAMTATLIDLA